MAPSNLRAFARAGVVVVTIVFLVIPAAADDFSVCARESGDVAIAACNRAIQSRKYSGRKLAELYRFRGWEYYSTKHDTDRGIADIDQAIRVDPNFADAFNSRCNARAIEGQLHAALGDCNNALRLAPDTAAYLDTRGITELKLGAWDNAIRDYTAALKRNPKIAASLYGRGLAKRKKADSAGGNADIAAAKAIQANIAEEMATVYGVK